MDGIPYELALLFYYIFMKLLCVCHCSLVRVSCVSLVPFLLLVAQAHTKKNHSTAAVAVLVVIVVGNDVVFIAAAELTVSMIVLGGIWFQL